jgi:predicted lipoprotein with Yx(FWY)xxD motif
VNPRLIVAATAGLGLAAAGASASAAPQAAAAHQKISTVQTSLGRVLSSPAGRVIYLFEKDAKNVSHCNTTCQAYWPPVMSSGAPSAAGGVSASHLARTSAGQVTYFGHPLYYFVGDTKLKQTRGEGSTESGAKWYVIATNGKAIE